MPRVNQTALLFGALMFGFLVFITMRGDLGKWLGVFGLSKSNAAPTSSAAVGGAFPTAPIAPTTAALGSGLYGHSGYVPQI